MLGTRELPPVLARIHLGYKVKTVSTAFEESSSTDILASTSLEAICMQRL
jgi:hypothetical protein